MQLDWTWIDVFSCGQLTALCCYETVTCRVLVYGCAFLVMVSELCLFTY